MCGIAGFSHTTDVTRAMLPHLLWDIESRGKDSWGGADGTEHSVRAIGPVTHSFHEHEEYIRGWERGIFHTRGASTGEVSIENQHPFQFSKGEGDAWERTVVGIHNGIVSNHTSLNHKYSRTCSVDSMHIYMHFAAGLPMRDIHGWGNLAWYEYTPTTPSGVLRLARFNNDACKVAKLTTGEIVFCSLSDPIRRAARMAGSGVAFFYKTEEEFIYTVDTDLNTGRWELYKESPKCPFGTRTEYIPFHSAGGTTYHGGSSTTSSFRRTDYFEGICAVVGCREKVPSTRKEALLCGKHYGECMEAVRAGVVAGVGGRR